MTSTTILLMMAIVAQFLTIHSITIPREIKGEKQLVQVEFMDDHQQGRYRRAVAGGSFEFPETLTFTVTIDNSSVTIFLRLNDLQLFDTPAMEIREDTVVRPDIGNSMKYALYQDVNTRASYIVNCDGPAQEDCELHGSFYHKQRKYHMTPHSTGMHELTKTPDTDMRDFGHDALIPPDHVRNENRRSGNDSQDPNPKTNLRESNIVEFLVVTDEAVYNEFEAKSSTPVEAMLAYYKLIVNEIDLHYLSVPMVDSSLNIRVVFAGLLYASTEDYAPWSRDNTVTIDGTAYLNANGALNSFTSWRNNVRSRITYVHEHAMAFTMKNFEFVSNGRPGRGLAGQAWLNQVCRSWDTSITEDDGSRTANTAAHELGHSLGANHDESTACPSTDRNIMTPSLYGTTTSQYAEAQWTFSSCSVRDFRNHINDLGSNCMRQHNFENSVFTAPRSLPGEVFSIDQQCKMFLGESGRSCSAVSASSCYSGTRCCRDNYYWTFYPMAGTPCGDNMWCYRGRCVAKTVDPPTNYCKKQCCVEKPKGTKCCKGKRCCRKRWGKKTKCCRQCNKA